MEGFLTYEECKKVLETFQNVKGKDGFTVEFYQFFFSNFLDIILLRISMRPMSLPSLKEEALLL